MDEFVTVIIIAVAVLGPIIAGAAKKAADKKAREKLDETRRRYGNHQQRPPVPRRTPYTQYGTRQWAPPPKTQDSPLPTPASTARQFALDEGAIAQAAQAQYAQYAPPEVSQEQTRPSFDVQFQGDVAVGKVGQSQLLSDAFSTGNIAISSFDTQQEAVAQTVPILSSSARALLGPLKGPALKRAILLREILGPPKALEM